jgi:hypothetical protein
MSSICIFSFRTTRIIEKIAGKDLERPLNDISQDELLWLKEDYDRPYVLSYLFLKK